MKTIPGNSLFKWILFTFVGFSSAVNAHFDHEPEETQDELKSAVLETLEETWGWCSKEKATSFMDLVFETKPKLCVEIGVYSGASFLPVAAALKHNGYGEIVGIDPWDVIEIIRHFDVDKDQHHLRFWVQINHNQVYFGFIQLLKRFDVESNSIIFRETSSKVAPIINEIDILHIDGNHAQKTIEEDVKNYLPKVKEGGYIWLNDSLGDSHKPAYNLLMESCDIVKTVDHGNCTLFKKR